MRFVLLVLLAACNPTTSETPEETDVVESDVPEVAENTWYIDDEGRTGQFPSLNCQMRGELLVLNGADTGGMGTLQLLFGNRPTGVESFEVVAETPAAGQCAVSIGRDREEDDQYLATGGTVEVTVVDTAPRAILVVFNDLPSSTRAGATALLSGDVGAREGTFLGACDFDEL